MTKILPVILSGGYGTRLWPLSRKHYPKQFIEGLLGDEGSLFEGAVKLVCGSQFLPPLIVSNASHKFFVLDAFLKLGLPYSGIILEPESKNTALSIFLASLWARENYGEDVVLLCMPSDHLIEQPELFLESVKNAAILAGQGMIATFGVVPTFAATGYGYIESGEPLAGGHKVARFLEKPTREKAEELLSSGKFLWNAGIFCFKAGSMISEASRLAPVNLDAAEACLKSAVRQEKIITLGEQEFSRAENISIDYAVMERSRFIAVARMLSAWSDVGDFIGLSSTLKHDAQGNCGEAVFMNAKDTSVFSQKLVVVNGVEGLVIVETADALLVSAKKSAQDVKKAVEKLQIAEAEEVLFGRKVYRPWGFYEVLQEGPGYKVKRIMLKPGSSLSLQSHAKRAENWVVVEGIANVTVNDDLLVLERKGVVNIPIGAKHRLENKGKEVLTIIETQIGDYLGEDDIVRYGDLYGRS